MAVLLSILISSDNCGEIFASFS